MRALLFSLLSAVLVLGSAAPSRAQPKPPELVKTTDLVDGKTLDQWMHDLKDKDPSVRERAISSLKYYGPAARGAVPTLIATFRDRDVALRVNAAISLGLIGMEEKDHNAGINGLVQLLSDNQANVRFQAAMALGRLGTDARPAVPKLLSAISDLSTWEVRQAAAFALGRAAVDRTNGPDGRVIKALLGALWDSSAQVRLEAVQALVLLGPPVNPAEASNAQRILKQLITNDRNKLVNIWGRLALMRMEGKANEQQVAAIGKHLKDADPEVRVHAARALASLGAQAKSQVPDLVARLDDSVPQVVSWAIVALGMMGDKAVAALPPLNDIKQNHKEPAIKKAAEEAIDRINQKPKKG